MTPLYFTVLFLCTLAFGSVIGAYFGTADYRIRNNEPLVTSCCYCPKCRHVLPLLHQIPILSWIFLGGKCHYCKEPIPLRYPLIEGGFLAYYGVTFLLFWRRPLLLPCVWLGFAAVLLLLRSRRLSRSLGKGILIFAAYHLLYGFLLCAVLASLRSL